jgi:RimJ/RimL family protein N-acetyltransferase
MVIETERLLLREYVPDDFDARFEILSDQETLQNIDGEMLPEIGHHIHKKYWRRSFAVTRPEREDRIRQDPPV